MKYTGITYRPPFEANSLLLQVTTGCSHNSCSFCTMYKDVPFTVESTEQIRRDLEEARIFYPGAKRVFLENGDPFALSADRLKEIARMIHDYLPEVETIAMYASINNIKNKTDEDLRELRALGINELNIGVESGLESSLLEMNKGYTRAEAYEQLMRLNKAGIDFGANIIFGIAGEGNSEENAIATAKLLNETKPYLIFTGTMHSDEGCPLYEDMQSGKFVENTIDEYLDEARTFFEHLDLKDTFIFSLHPSNIVRFQGDFNSNKEKILDLIEDTRSSLSSEQLSSRPKRFGEGGIYL